MRNETDVRRAVVAEAAHRYRRWRRAQRLVEERARELATHLRVAELTSVELTLYERAIEEDP